MSSAKLAVAVALAALALAGCGTVDVKPAANANGLPSRGRIDDPRSYKPNHVQCLRADDLTVREVGVNDLEVGSGPGLVYVHFEPTPGAAQAAQIEDREQAAEVIGSALVYPGQASDGELTKVERCIAQGVSG